MNSTLRKDYIGIANELRNFDHKEDREQQKCHIFDPIQDLQLKTQ